MCRGIIQFAEHAFSPFSSDISEEDLTRVLATNAGKCFLHFAEVRKRRVERAIERRGRRYSSNPINWFERSKSGGGGGGGRNDDAGIGIITGRENVKHSLQGNI